jgi:hypothetical protein
VNDDFEDRIAAALNAHVDRELGERRTPPPFEAPAPNAARRRPRRAPWMLPLVAAASVVAVVAGTVGATQLVADDGPATHPSPLVSGSVSPSADPSADPSAAPSSAVSTPNSPAPSATPNSSHSTAHSQSHSTPPPSGTTVTLDGSRIVLPPGWRARYLGINAAATGPEPSWCIDRSRSPSSACAINLARLGDTPKVNGRPGLDVDVEGAGTGNPPQYLCGAKAATKAESYADRSFGGRAADWRRWDRHCSVTGRSYHSEQWVVATEPGWIMSSDTADPSTSAAMVYIAQNSQLTAQTRPLRMMDRGIVRSAHRSSGDMRIQLDRETLVITSIGVRFENKNPATYAYVVPIALWRASRFEVGDEVRLATDGSRVVVITGEPF